MSTPRKIAPLFIVEAIMKTNEMKNLKLNYHMLESCNFGCKFCFAPNAEKNCLPYTEMREVVEKACDSGCFSGINFAGGEPFLVKRLPDLIRLTKEHGLFASVITNGSLLNKEILDSVLPYLDTLGISVHSADDEKKRKIGSCKKSGGVLSNEHLEWICHYVRENSDCRIKLNTVVNAFNKDEAIAPFIQNLGIDRWKVLRCQPFGNNFPLLVTDEEWRAFCGRNTGVFGTVFEDNMKDTYIMLNPVGQLVTENDDGSYNPVGSVLENDMKDLLSRLPLRLDAYQARYIA